MIKKMLLLQLIIVENAVFTKLYVKNTMYRTSIHSFHIPKIHKIGKNLHSSTQFARNFSIMKADFV